MYGAILGDIIGEPYEFDRGEKSKKFPLFSKRPHFTDDTVMTIAICDGILNAGLDADEPAMKKSMVGAMHYWGNKYPRAGYGARFIGWLSNNDSESLEERIFTSNDLPYSSQLIPLSVLCTLLREKKMLNVTANKDKLRQWYWCGVLGELYGGTLETRYVNDVVGVMDWISGGSQPKTVQDAYFSPMRLLSLQTRQSAAYKGIMALIMKNHSKDFIGGRDMDLVNFKSDNIDIHHIFPKVYCERKKCDKKIWNSVVNKTPISYDTNRRIGGEAPSKYLAKIEKDGSVNSDTLNSYIASHFIDVSALRRDDFSGHIIARAKNLLDVIEKSMGKSISGRDSQEVVEAFGKGL